MYIDITIPFLRVLVTIEPRAPSLPCSSLIEKKNQTVRDNELRPVSIVTKTLKNGLDTNSYIKRTAF